MFDNKTLLERMVSISPGARLLMDGKLYLQHIDEDDITDQQLVNECFSCMIDEAYELGLEFFCTREDLCDSFYHLDKVLMLFEVLFPTPLYRSLNEDAGFNTYIRSVIIDAAGDPELDSAMNILTYLSQDHPEASEIFQETYLFLHDKMKCTPIFDQYVESILEVSNTPIEVPVDDQAIQAYVSTVSQRVSRLLQAVDKLKASELKLSEDVIERLYTRVDLFKTNATAPENQFRYAWLHDMQTHPEPNPMEQALMVRYTQDFQSTTPLYDAYFLLRQEPFDQWDLLSAVLGCFIETTTKEAFAARVDPAMDKMMASKFCAATIQPQMLIHRAVATLTTGFYS